MDTSSGKLIFSALYVDVRHRREVAADLVDTSSGTRIFFTLHVDFRERREVAVHLVDSTGSVGIDPMGAIVGARFGQLAWILSVGIDSFCVFNRGTSRGYQFKQAVALFVLSAFLNGVASRVGLLRLACVLTLAGYYFNESVLIASIGVVGGLTCRGCCLRRKRGVFYVFSLRGLIAVIVVTDYHMSRERCISCTKDATASNTHVLTV